MRRPKSNVKGRLEELLLELVASCKSVSLYRKFGKVLIWFIVVPVSLSFLLIFLFCWRLSSHLSLCRQFSLFSDRRSQFRPNNLDHRRRDFIKKNLVSVFWLTCPFESKFVHLSPSATCLPVCVTGYLSVSRSWWPDRQWGLSGGSPDVRSNSGSLLSRNYWRNSANWLKRSEVIEMSP